MPFGWRLRIEAHGHMRRFLVIDEIEQGIDKPKLRIGIAPGSGYPRIADKRIIGAENERHGIEEK